jgi:hypothetical protein
MAVRKRGVSLLFDDSKGHHRNDIITLNRNFSPYGGAFYRAASSLAKPFLDGRGNFLDSDGLPVVYLYRHALELYLKGIILAGNNLMRQMGEGLSEEEAMDRIASGKNPHGLSRLLPDVENVFLFVSIHMYASGIKNVDGIGFDDCGPIKRFSDIRRCIEDFDKVDPKAVATRYPVDKRSKRPPLESYAYTLEGSDDFFGFSVNKFVETIDPLVKLLGGFAAQLEDWEREQEEEPYDG